MSRKKITDMKYISGRLVYLIDIIAKGNQKKFSEIVNIPASTINRYLTQEVKNPPIEQIIKIVKAVGCSLEWLADGQGNVFIEQEYKLAAENERSGEARGHYNPSPGDPDDLPDLVRQFLDVMRSGDTITSEALKQNVIAFHVSVRRAEGAPADPRGSDFKIKKKKRAL